LSEKRIKQKDQIQVQRTFDRRTGELNGLLSGSARFISLLITYYYGRRSIFAANRHTDRAVRTARDGIFVFQYRIGGCISNQAF
jgi:hypothetical protein